MLRKGTSFKIYFELGNAQPSLDSHARGRQALDQTKPLDQTNVLDLDSPAK
ncbi:hypothetical protein AB8P51_10100 [Muriicola sp. SD30]|uniref:hypothetical protein n=1 Tax=Muriicola sp. SD30 TaxID=3240936 RepID=UPI00350F3D20